MRVLFATGSAASYMLPPILGDEQIMCGPDWADKREPNGRVHSLKTPVGEYDLAVIAAKLSQSQQPDVVVCLVDASWRNLPRNLAAFPCPKVLLIADTHHLTAPLMNMLRYMAAEPYDRAVFLYDRHHAAFFHAAGFRNLYWFPGLTFPHSDKTVRKARTWGVRQPQIAFVGQAGALHPFRTRMLAAMSEKRLPLTQRRLSQTDSLGFYGASLLGFNASLNGDLNLRIFEILSTGAALLTDRLTPESGLGRLLADGREMLTYGSDQELIEKATHALTNPREAQAIGAAGSAWFDKHFNQAWRLSAFKSLALDGKPVPEFDFSAEEKTRVIFGGDTDRLLQGLMVYETVQELHRTEPVVRLTAGPGVPAEVSGFFTSLPRLRLKSGVEAPDCDLAEVAIFGKSSDVPPEAHKVWCWDVALGEREALVARMAELGFNQINPDAAMFSPSRLIAAEHLEVARMLMQINHLDKAFQHAQAAVQADPGCVEALFLISELALKAEQSELAKGTFAELEKRAPHDPRLIGLAEQLGLPLPSVAGQPPAGTGRHVLLYTDDPEAGGVAQYNHAILCALARAGYRVTCLQSRVENSLIAEQRSLGIRHRWIGYDTKQYFGRALVDGMEAQHCFQVDRPDLVLFSNCCPFSSLAAREYTRLLGIPYMVVEGFVGEYLVRNFAEHLPTLARQYAEARQVVAVSQENLQLLRSRFGLAGSAGQVIHYGRPDTFFAPRNEAVRARLRIELGLPADAIVCFTAARLAEVKRFDLQIAALEGLQKSSIAESLHCVWAGDGELREVLSREIAARGLSGRIHLIGHRWDVADWYDAADIFVLTSQTEGMPLAIMEAMAKGLPVVASAISGIPEELGGTGRLLPDPAVDAAGAVRMLAETLAQWAGDAALRTQTGQACRARAWDCFREERMVSQTLTLVESSLAVEISRPVPVAGSADGDAVPAGEVKAESQTAAVREQVVVLTDLPTHSLYSSWLKDAPFAINYVVLADLQYTFPEGTTLVVSHDCYREPQVALLRQAVERGIPTLILADGTLDYRNTWEKPQIPPGAIFQPVLGHKIACFGRSQARVLESWGNGGRCEVVGAPRYDGYNKLIRRKRLTSEPFRVLICTGMVPYCTETHHQLVRESLLDLKKYFETHPVLDGVRVEPVWRLTGTLGQEIGVDSAITRQSGPKMTDVLQTVDAMITWPSTVMVDAMLLHLPVAIVDYCNLPNYVPAAWRITVQSQIEPTLRELIQPPPPKMLFQDSTLHDTLECHTPAGPRMLHLAEAMIEAGRQARQSRQLLCLPARILELDGDALVAPEASASLEFLYPGHDQFQKRDLAALQVEVGHLRAYASELERRLMSTSGAVLAMAAEASRRHYRMIPDMSRSEILSGHASQMALWQIEMNGKGAVPCIHLHPPAKVKFTVPTGAVGRFVSAITLHPDVWSNPACGPSEFRVTIDGRLTFSQTTDPAHQAQERRWLEIELLAPFSPSGFHEIVLETASAAPSHFCCAVWRDPLFEWSGSED